MSGLETLSLVANIFQVIGFACDTVGLCKAIYRGELPDAVLKEYGDSLSTLSAQVQAQCNNSAPQTKDEKALADIAAKCNVAARALADEADFLTSHQAKGSLVSTLKIVSKTKWRQRRLERLERALDDYRKILETQLLVRLCTQSRAGELRLKDGFDKLDKNLQNFIDQYASGSLQLTDLVRAEMASTRAHTTRQCAKTQQNVNAHVTLEVNRLETSLATRVARMGGEVQNMSQTIQRLNVQAVSGERRDRLLRSLKYPGMNARRNQITTSYAGTFQWILDVEESSDGGSDHDLFFPGSATGFFLDAQRAEQARANDDGLNALDQHHRSDNFSEWLKSDNDLFWISGKPGSGKSTLVKFLVSHAGTGKALEIWKPNTYIMSHFLWKPGSEMQNSVKGLICSLIHQALSLESDILASILAKFPLLVDKDEHNDWSLEELRSVFTVVFSSYPAPICVFIDGLDEICEKDGIGPLMKIVQDLRRGPNIKVCVSSRPESRFFKLLGNQQHLRLQDLTAKDMRRFAYMSLEPYLKQPTAEYGSDLSEYQPCVLFSITEKAEGVFLWLHLAIQSLIRGFEQGDDGEDLLRRLNTLPGELTALYSEMWMRLNDDAPLYRESTARYLNLILDSQDVRAEVMASPYNKWRGVLGLPGNTTSLFALVASAHPYIQEVFLDNRDIMPASQLNDICAKTCDSVLLRCAGLVEVLSFTNSGHQEFKAVSEYGIIQVHLDSYPYLVHRTAYDFLKYTTEGQRILGHDPASKSQRRIQLVRGELVRARISTDQRKYRGEGNAIMDILIPVSLTKSITFEPKREILYTCGEWYENGYLTYHETSLSQPKPHFLAVVASYGLEKFVRSELTLHAASSSLATLVLSDVAALDRVLSGTRDILPRKKTPRSLYTGYTIHTDEAFLKHVSFIKYLLGLHPDFNARPGWYPYGYAERNPDGSSYVVTSISPFASILMRNVGFAEGPSPQLMGLISTMLTAGADLNQRIPLQISVYSDDYRDAGGLLLHVSPEIGPWYWIRGKTPEITTPGQIKVGLDNFSILLDVNLAFLVKILHSNVNIAAQGELPDSVRLAFKNFTNATETVLDPRRGFCNPHACVSLIAYGGMCIATQQVPQSASGRIMQILEPLLFGDSSLGTRDRWEEMTSRCCKLVRKEILNHYKEWQIISKEWAEFLADEGCGFRWVDAHEFASMTGKPETSRGKGPW